VYKRQAFRRPERLDKFLLACEADARGRTGLEDCDYPQRDYLTAILNAASGIDNKSVIANSKAGPKEAIAKARLRVVTDSIETIRHE